MTMKSMRGTVLLAGQGDWNVQSWIDYLNTENDNEKIELVKTLLTVDNVSDWAKKFPGRLKKLDVYPELKKKVLQNIGDSPDSPEFSHEEEEETLFCYFLLDGHYGYPSIKIFEDFQIPPNKEEILKLYSECPYSTYAFNDGDDEVEQENIEDIFNEYQNYGVYYQTFIIKGSGFGDLKRAIKNADPVNNPNESYYENFTESLKKSRAVKSVLSFSLEGIKVIKGGNKDDYSSIYDSISLTDLKIAYTGSEGNVSQDLKNYLIDKGVDLKKLDRVIKLKKRII